MKKLIATVFLFILVTVAQTADAQTPTAADWQADLQFMAERMQQQHPGLLRRVSKADFDRAVKTLNDQIPTANEDEILVGIMRIVALIRDGHTGFFPAERFKSGVFPLRFYKFEDGLFIQRAAPQYAELVGARIVKVGSLTVDEAMSRVASITGADNSMGVSENAPVLMAVPELLHGLGIINSTDSLSLTVEVGGKQRSVTVTPSLTVRELINPPDNWADLAASKPLYLQHPRDTFWFEYIKETRVLYVQQNAVADKPEETVAKFYERVMKFAAENPVDKLVIDLRRNDGGNNGLNRPVVIGIIKSKLDERGKLFVITGRRTFSAAQNFVNEFEKYTKATFVGEPTAGRPNHYGDGRPINLPRTGLHVQASTLHWQDMDPRDDRPWTAPEISAPLTSDEYRRGVDPALDAVLAYRPGTGLNDMIAAAPAAKEISTVIRNIEAYTRDPLHKFVESEAAINRLGYDLVRSGRAADGLGLFLLNTRLHPASANVYDSLGDGYQAVGNKAEAIKAYEKALSIDPTYSSSKDALRKLKGQ